MVSAVLKSLLLLAAVQQACCVVRLDLTTRAWQLSSSNGSISLQTHPPVHVLGALAAAGMVQQDPLYRYGELETRWVSQDTWNFTVTWPGQQHSAVAACRHVLLLLHGIDTFGHVLLNGRQVLAADNAHRSWWVVLREPSLLREGPNTLSVVLQPAVSVALRSKVRNAYSIPTMAVPGGFDVYNFARKPASDFGWDWGPAFAPAGLTGGVELLGFDRASLIGALVHQQRLNESSSFLLTVTAQLLVPQEGDCGLLSAALPVLGLQQEQQVVLQAGRVAGNDLQALATIQLPVPAGPIRLWQPAGRLAPGQKQALYDVKIHFRPAVNLHHCRSSAGSSSSSSSSSSNDSSAAAIEEACAMDGSCSSITRRIGFRTIELVRQPMHQAAAELARNAAATASSSSSVSSAASKLSPADLPPGQPAAAAAVTAQPGSWAQVQGVWQLVRNTSQSPVWWHPQPPPGRDWPLPASHQPDAVRAAAAAAAAAGAGWTDASKCRTNSQDVKEDCGKEHAASNSHQQTAASATAKPQAASGGKAASIQSAADDEEEEGESFYFRVNGLPLYAKGANLIPLHVLSSAVADDDVVGLLQSAAAANMNMVRIWGGGLYQRDALYAAADELGLLVWQEAMFACSPYPRDAAFLPNVEAEVAQQLLRLGSHPSIALWGGNNEIEASLEWYDETRGNLALFAVDYQALFVDTIGRVAQQMLPGVLWVDSSPSNGIIALPQQHNTPAAAAAAAREAQQDQVIKRWGNPQNPKYGDVHFYDYKNDCQDWRTYPAARFISEYGWQSYPTWATYSAATAPQDWAVTADMTEFRQRHPNGTVELLAQLQRRFKLPQPWLQLLQLHSKQQQQDGRQPEEADGSSSGNVARCFGSWGCWWQQACSVWCTELQQHLMQWSAQLFGPRRLLAWQMPWLSGGGSSSSSSSSSSSGSNARHVGSMPEATTSSSSSSSALAAAGSDMQHYIYLAQLQQLLCYETAVSYWRRLRSDAAVGTMGVLYWQLNDIWQGASWSSLDYGGAWKPLHYGLGRWFADVALSVQHDLQGDAIHVHIVSDMPHPMKAQLTVRMLSLADTPASCSSSSSSSSSGDDSSGIHSSGIHSSRGHARTLQHDSSSQRPATATSAPVEAAAAAAAAAAAPWAKHSETVQLTVPPASAVLAWSGTAAQLLAAAPGCSSSSCYVHITLAATAADDAAGQDGSPSVPQQLQEATVWLAPFAAMQLPQPNLQLSDFKFVATDAAQSAKQTSSAGSSSGSSDQKDKASAAGEASFTVSSSRVAAFAVWELTKLEWLQLLPGHFTQNAVTVHPCEPRVVRFLPRLGASSWSSYVARLQDWQRQQQRQQPTGAEQEQAAAAASSDKSSSSGVFEDTSSGQLLALLLQQSIAASSLYDHQQFEQGPSVAVL